MQSRASIEETRSVLQPANSNSLNVASHTSNHTVTSRKRKSSDLEPDTDGTNTDMQIFTADLLSGKATLSFTSVTLVARACLPLAWLNTCSSQILVFQAEIPSVEEWEQRVLVVRKVPNGGLYAVEQVGKETYVACALHSWVTEAWCHDAAIGRIAEVRVEELLSLDDNGTHPSHSRTGSVSGTGSILTPLPTPTSPKRPKNRKGALARMSILAPRDAATGQDMKEIAVSVLVPQQPDANAIETSLVQEDISSGLSQQQPVIAQPLVQEPLPITPAAQISSQNPFDIAVPVDNCGMQDTEPLAVPEALLNPSPDSNPLATERLRTQYFEHLYISKTSLAFYVKGPLSRARAHVRTAEDATKAIKELFEFYEQSVLPTKKVDLKYKESVAKVVKELPVLEHEIDGTNATEPKKRKSRKTKMKLGKDCLWPGEEDFIAKWWHGRDVKGTVATSDQAEDMRKELADLRLRETKMQMLLILEIMLLDTAASKLAESKTSADPEIVVSVSDKPAPSDSDIKLESIEQESAAAVLATTPLKLPKKEKKRDWAAEIDTIVDRLCIWHTVNLDDLGNVGEEKSSKNDANGSTAWKPNDSLHDFCRDVLRPFYSAKLPTQVKSVSRKLSGNETSPKQVKQPRPQSALHRSSSSISSLSKAKPGQPLSKRTLERVLSEDHQHLRHASPPVALSRASSISAPIIPTLKREPSERPASRGGMLSKSVSFSSREIDFVADQKVHDAKRRKLDRLAQQKKELEAAIDALKKPDRRAVASQVMDEAEERKRLELEKKMAVQISATPRSRRTKGHVQLMEEPELPPMPIPRLVAREQEPAMVIPSSTMKPRLRPGLSSSASMPRSSATKRAVLAAIHETPSRGVENKTSNPLDLPAASNGLAEIIDSTVIVATPARCRAAADAEHLLSSGVNLSSSQLRPLSSQLVQDGGGLQLKRSRRPVLFTPVKKTEAHLDQVFRDAPEVPEEAGRKMDRVMGGKGRGMEEAFQLPRSNPAMKPEALDVAEQKPGPLNEVDDGDIYDKLGWNDDFDL